MTPFRSNLLSRPLRVLVAGSLLALGACQQSYPLGMSEAEWLRLTPEQQLAARSQQAEINRANAERYAQTQAAERERQAILQAEELARREAIYQEARYGDILECVVEGGIADFHPGWRGYSPAPFTLARGEDKYVPLSDGSSRPGRFWAGYSQDGREVSICHRDPNGRRAGGCATVHGMFRDFAAGIRRQFTAPDVFQNANLMCSFRPGPGMPPTVRQVEVRRVIELHHHHTRTVAPPPVVVRERVIVEQPRQVREHPSHGRGQVRDQRPTERIVRGVSPVVPPAPAAPAPQQAAETPPVPKPAASAPPPSAATAAHGAPAKHVKRRKDHKPHPPMPPQSQAEQHAAPNSGVHRQASGDAAVAPVESGKKGKAKGHAKHAPEDGQQPSESNPDGPAKH
jgi:hypothetical protein